MHEKGQSFEIIAYRQIRSLNSWWVRQSTGTQLIDAFDSFKLNTFATRPTLNTLSTLVWPFSLPSFLSFLRFFFPAFVRPLARSTCVLLLFQLNCEELEVYDAVRVKRKRPCVRICNDFPMDYVSSHLKISISLHITSTWDMTNVRFAIVQRTSTHMRRQRQRREIRYLKESMEKNRINFFSNISLNLASRFMCGCVCMCVCPEV